MTKRHFVALAAALQAEQPMRDAFTDAGHYHSALTQWHKCVAAVADVAQSQNGQFDRDRFMRAAGVRVR